VLGNTEPADSSFVVVDQAGRRISVEVSSVPLTRGEHVIGVFGQVSDLVEEPQPEGPYGAKGIGEAALVPTAAAAAGALYAFDGIRRTRLPMKDSPAAVAAVPHLVRRGKTAA